MMKENLVGKFILDNDKLGLITNEISQGTWSEDPYFSWLVSYEIYYFENGNRCIMTEASLKRLVCMGKIIFLKEK
jgi:hypothetical protein